jgi:hypothetical protein
VYDTSNSGLPDNVVHSIAIDAVGNKWIGTYNGGLTKFDGTTWTVYNTSNSGLPNDFIHSIAIDRSGIKWIGTYLGGLAKFDGSTWRVYNRSNSGLPNSLVMSIAIDRSGNKWIGTSGGGLAKYDGTTWKVYNTSNSDLPSDNIWPLAIDSLGNAWVGADGISVYKEGGVVSVKETQKSNLPEGFALRQNYPNPFNPTTIISYQLPIAGKVNLTIYNLLGRKIKTLVDSFQSAGEHSIVWSATSDANNPMSSGIYFYRLKTRERIVQKKMVLVR